MTGIKYKESRSYRAGWSSGLKCHISLQLRIYVNSPLGSVSIKDNQLSASEPKPSGSQLEALVEEDQFSDIIQR